MKPRIGIVGAGVVGSAMQRLFVDARVYDIKPGWCSRSQINECDIVFVAVPTPPSRSGSCDISAVEDAVGWIASPLIVIRSTVPPGTTDYLKQKYNKRIVFEPEYLGETPAHVFQDLSCRDFIVLGGDPPDLSPVADLYKGYCNSQIRFVFCDARTAELAKYMENCFFATKVTFVNEFYELARVHGVNFDLLREVWLADPRIGRDHTFVYPDARGFSGKCLPKDLKAAIAGAAERGYAAPFLAAVQKANEEFLERNSRQDAPVRHTPGAAVTAS